MIARSRRAWLEPVVWVTPGAIVGVLTLVLGWETRSTTSIIIGIALTVLALMIGMLVGVSRPPWYHQLLLKLGVFKSARPRHGRRGLGRTFQNIRLFQNMTALENVLVGMHSKLRAAGSTHSCPRRGTGAEKEARVKAQGFLALVGLKGRDDELAKNLPYGDQRRLEVARALASEPVLLLLDEPTAGMNPRETQQLTSLIGRLRN